MIALLCLALSQEPPLPPPPPRVRPQDEDPVFKRDAEERPPEPRRGPARPEAPPRPGAALEEVKAWLRENEPETHRRVERAIEEGRRQDAARVLMEAEPRMREMEGLKARDPRAFEKLRELRRLERESLDLAERVRAAAPADRETGAKKLRESLDRLFDLREEAKGRDLEELKRRVAELEKQLEARKAAKQRIVDRRARELLGERLPDDW